MADNSTASKESVTPKSIPHISAMIIMGLIASWLNAKTNIYGFDIKPYINEFNFACPGITLGLAKLFKNLQLYAGTTLSDKLLDFKIESGKKKIQKYMNDPLISDEKKEELSQQYQLLIDLDINKALGHLSTSDNIQSKKPDTMKEDG